MAQPTNRRLVTEAALAPQLAGKAPLAAGVPTGGLTGQVLAKASGANHSLTWINPPSGGGGGGDGKTEYVYWTGSAWPARPTSDGTVTVWWVGGTAAVPPPGANRDRDMWVLGVSA